MRAKVAGVSAAALMYLALSAFALPISYVFGLIEEVPAGLSTFPFLAYGFFMVAAAAEAWQARLSTVDWGASLLAVSWWILLTGLCTLVQLGVVPWGVAVVVALVGVWLAEPFARWSFIRRLTGRRSST